MRVPIELDNQSEFGTIKINYISQKWLLSSKLIFFKRFRFQNSKPKSIFYWISRFSIFFRFFQEFSIIRNSLIRVSIPTPYPPAPLRRGVFLFSIQTLFCFASFEPLFEEPSVTAPDIKHPHISLGLDIGNNSVQFWPRMVFPTLRECGSKLIVGHN